MSAQREESSVAQISERTERVPAAFLKKLPLPALEEFKEQPAARAGDLYRVTEAEARAFPGTIGEAIGLNYWDGQKSWVMTESGWIAGG